MRIHVNVVRFVQLAILIAALGFLMIAPASTPAARANGPEDTSRPRVTVVQPSSAPTGTSAIFGIDEQDLLGWNPNARGLATAAGINWTRVSVSWNAIEGTEGTFKWTGTDNTLNGLLGGGLQPVVYISDNPSWASPSYANGCGPVYTIKLASFTTFVTQLVQRYPQIKIWALYNEPDNVGNGGSASPCFGGTRTDTNGNPYYVDYALMLAAAKQGIIASGVNPQPKLAVGALAYDNFVKGKTTCPPKYPGTCNATTLGGFDYSFPANLFKYIKANGGTSLYVDMLLFNYYDVYASFWQTLGKGYGITAKANALRNVMTKAGVPVLPLLVSETGEHSAPDGGAEGLGLNGQATCVDVTFTRGAAAGLTGIVWWTFRDYSADDGFPYSNWKYGLVDANLNPKPSYTAMHNLTTELNGFTFKKDWSNKATKKGTFTNVESYQFTNGITNKYVVWSSVYLNSSAASHGYTSPCAWARKTAKATFKAKTLRVVDYLGNVTTIKDNKKGDKDKVVGTITIQLGNTANAGGGTPHNPTVVYPLIVQINPPAQ